MTYTLEAEKKINIKAKGIERILQNGCNILSVIQGEVVLGRAIGIDGNIIDSPLNKAKDLMNIKAQFKKYEPRLRVEKISYISDHIKGNLKASVEVRVIE